MSAEYIFIIDTRNHAEDFYREMTAYLTGHVGACGVGENMVETCCEPLPAICYKFVENILRPCSFDKNSVMIFLDRQLTEEEAELLTKRAREFAEISPSLMKYLSSPIHITGFRLVRRSVVESKIAEWADR